MPSVSVIVPVFNGIEHLPQFFASLAEALPDQAHVVVIDDASTQPVLETVPDLSRAIRVDRIRNEANLGNAAALNRGIELSNADIVVLLNSDLVLHPRCIGAMVELIEQRTRSVGMVGSKLLYPTTGRTQSVGMAFGRYSKRHVYRHLPHDHSLCQVTRETQIVTGATAATTKRVLELLGPFDNELYNHNLDLDYCLRATEQGLRNFMCADSVAYHWRNRSGAIRYARVDAAEAAFWAKWGGRYNEDLGRFFDEALADLATKAPQFLDATPIIVDLSRGDDQTIALDHLRERWPKIPQSVRNFRQMSNSAERIALPLVLPHWMSQEPSRFLYLVDSHDELNDNAMWFAQRRRLVDNELIVDLSATVCTTAEFCAWQGWLSHG